MITPCESAFSEGLREVFRDGVNLLGLSAPTYNRPLQIQGLMQDQWTHVAEPHRHQWVLRRNCAMSPRQLLSCLGALALVSLGIAGAFAWHGAWFVLPFACLEVLALAIAFLVHARHAGDHERIVMSADGVLVELASAQRVWRMELPAGWVRIEYREASHELVRLVSGRTSLEVGRYVSAGSRGGLADDLKAKLAELRRQAARE